MDNKKLIDLLSEKTGLDRDLTVRTLQNLCDIIGETVADEDCILVPSFGTFEPKKKMERVVVHPSSGKKLLVPPRLTIGFRPSSALKNDLKG